MRRRDRHNPDRAYGVAAGLLLVPFCLGALSCSDDMSDQPKAETMEATRFFDDGTVSRPRVPGTVARDEPAVFPPVTAELLELGRARFDGICAACHGADGYGTGIVVERGFPAPPSLHEPRLLAASDVHILRVIADGQGKMPAYGVILDRRERAAVLLYVRALQLSQSAPRTALPEAVVTRLNGPPVEGDAP